MSLDVISALLIGLAGSVHCVGMCGGMASAFSLLLPKHRSSLPYLIAYHGGRICSYALAGALVGSLGMVIGQGHGGALFLSLLSGLLLVLMGLYIGGWWRVLLRLERAGSGLWRRLSPLTRHLLPMNHPLKALPYGLVWGWLPCGLVYSTLSWAMLAQSPGEAAVLMFCFGLGTLPAMFLLSLSAERVLGWLRHPRVKQGIGGMLILYGGALVLLPLTDAHY